MRPEQLALALRPRSGWEAIDLGIRLVQANARGVFSTSFGVVLPVALLVTFVVGYLFGAPDIAGLIIWWLKPLYDRALLHGLAHAVFGERPSLRTTLRELPRLLWRSRLIPALTWRRLDPQRSVRLAVDQLEGLDRKLAKARRQIIPARVGGAGFALMCCFIHFEYVLLFGLVALVESALPDGVSILDHVLPWLSGDASLPADQASWIRLGFCLVYACMIAAMEPFYVAGGFCLYLKRRTDLEAWDLELLFHRVAREGAHRLVALAFVALCGMLALSPTDGYAADAAASDARREAAIAQAPKAVRDVLTAPEFGHSHKRSVLHLRRDEDKKDEAPADWLKRWLEFWRGAGRWMAEVLRVAGWLGIVLAIAALLWLLARQLGRVRARRAAPPPPAEIAGLDIRPESLPDDVAAAARRWLEQGQHREALGLLYRAALSRLAHRERIPFGRGDTEGDCLLRVTRAGSPSRTYFAQLTRHWQTVAYARTPLSHADGEALCAGWAARFGNAG